MQNKLLALLLCQKDFSKFHDMFSPSGTFDKYLEELKRF